MGRSIARSPARSLGRSLGRWLGRSRARSVDRYAGRSAKRSPRSLGEVLAPSLIRSPLLLRSRQIRHSLPPFCLLQPTPRLLPPLVLRSCPPNDPKHFLTGPPVARSSRFLCIDAPRSAPSTVCFAFLSVPPPPVFRPWPLLLKTNGPPYEMWGAAISRYFSLLDILRRTGNCAK